MTITISEVYEAAAEALSSESLATKADIVRIERELAVLKWMVGLVIAGVAAQIVKLFFV